MEYRDIIIGEDASLIEALKLLDKTGRRVLFVVAGEQLKAAVSDGDIRRFILSKGSLDAKVREFANYQPKFLPIERIDEADAYMRRHSLPVLPIVDRDKRIVSVIQWDADAYEKHVKPVRVPVVINAGGMGTRLYPYTKVLPKPLIPIGEYPIVEHIIRRFQEAGCNEFFMIVNEKRNMIKAYFNEIEKDYTLHFIDEEVPLGTGGGLGLLKGLIHETFIFSNCDTIIDEDYGKILRAHREKAHVITMICALKNFTIPYGVVETGVDGTIEALREKPEMSFLTNTGCYVLEPRVIEELVENRKIDFPSVVDGYRKNGEAVGIYPVSAGNWLDMGQLSELESTRERFEKSGKATL